MWSQCDPSLHKSGVGNIFVKNLDKSIDDKALYDTFSAFGNILSCKIICDEHGSRGYGFVHFETEEAARNAIEKVNGMLLNGKKVFVGRFMNRRERMEMMGDKVKKFNNVYVRNLSEDVDDDGLRDMFEPYGKIISAKAVEEMNGKEVRGKLLDAGRTQKKAERQAELKEKFERIKMERINDFQGVNLYVKNLDDVIDDERLRKEFSQFGNITSAWVMTENGRSMGCGYVCFSSPEEATKAVNEMNGRIILEKPMYVALAQHKEDCMRIQAVEKMNGKKVRSKVLSASRAQKKAARQAKLKEKFEHIKMERINDYQGVNLYVKNLDDVIDDERLRKEFSQFGNITSVRVMTENGRSMGCGYVCFSSPEEATKAVNEMNGRIILEKPMYVALAQHKEDCMRIQAVEEMNGKEVRGKLQVAGRTQKKAERQAELKEKFERIKMERINDYQGVNLYVKNLDDVIDDECLRKEFSQFGNINSAWVMTKNGRSMGCGYVCFSSPEEATKAVNEMNGRIVVAKPLYVALAQREEDCMGIQAVEEMNGMKVRGKVLSASRAQKKAARQAKLKEKCEHIKMERINDYQGVNLYVKNLDDVIDDERLRKEFSQFGNITSARVMTENGRTKGFGFVCFSSPEEATKAVTEMNGRIVVEKPLYVALAQRKADRKAHLASQYMQRIASMRIQSQQMGQMFQAGGAGYFVPTMPQAAQQGFFTPQTMPQMRAGPRWPTVRPNHPAGRTGYQKRPNRRTGPAATAQTIMSSNDNMHAVAGQSTTQPHVTEIENTVPGCSIFANVLPQLPHEQVRSTSPPQRSQMATQRSSSPMYPLSPSPPSFLRSPTPPPRSPTECFRPITPPQPGTSGLSRQLGQMDMEGTTWDLNEFEKTDTATANREYEESDDLEYFLDVLENLKQTLREKKDVVVRRNFLLEDLNKIYGEDEPEILQHTIRVGFEGELGIYGGGLTRDMFASYWNCVTKEFFHGETVKVPCVPTSRYFESQAVFQVAGRVLTHALLLTGSLPLDISVAFLWSAIKPLSPPTDETVLKDFSRFVSAAEARAIAMGLEETADVFSDDLMSQLMDIFTRFGMNNIPSPKHFREQVLKIARVELIVKPSYFGQIMVKGIPKMWMTDLWDCISECGLIQMHKSLQLTPQKVLQKLKTETDEKYLSSPEQVAFIYLKDFIRCLDSEALAQFLHFTTGSTSMPAEPIVVSINNHTGLNRIPKAHTCGPMLEISTAYSSLSEFKHELATIIFNDELYAMSLA